MGGAIGKRWNLPLRFTALPSDSYVSHTARRFTGKDDAPGEVTCLLLSRFVDEKMMFYAFLTSCPCSADQ